MKQKRLTKRCKYVYPRLDVDNEPYGVRPMECGNYMPDEYEICDDCLLIKYDLLAKALSDSADYEGMGPSLFEEDDVIDALRKAEHREVK